MRIFETRSFCRFAMKNGLSRGDLADAVRRLETGLVDADLGSGLFKQRVARRGQGRSGGFRVIVVFRVDDRSFFIHGFAKKDQDNIDARELAAFRKLAGSLLALDLAELAAAVERGALIEVNDDE